jgi:diguanylate cyclase (GGDEF)-like protein
MSGVLSNRMAMNLIDEAPECVVVCDARAEGFPVRYANRRFDQLMRHSSGGYVGNSFLKLAFFETQPAEQQLVGAAMQQGQGVRATLKSPGRGTNAHWMDVLIEPVREPSGVVSHFAAYFRPLLPQAVPATPVAPPPVCEAMPPEVTGTFAAMQPVLKAMREDSWLQDDHWARFEELLRHQWARGQRDGRALTLLVFEIDSLAAYRDTFGRTATDTCVRKVARLLSACYRRGTDVLARVGDGVYCALVHSTDLAATTAHAQNIAERVFDMQIHNPRSTRHRFLTLSVGVAHVVPVVDKPPQQLLNAAMAAAKRANRELLNHAVVADDGDFALA